ncbi:cytosolic endo-beta-N-acetylglucosaminidase 1-like isoform X1 [Punica granatum]|uniref:mannosyl-glycoprotein endo-beta-N-acetylglucosaminidase n=1 Tax=Punica granatum TaxID=22663 RepID=A0A6P8CDC2_PUNGR|nr:cytosolic endo-beta-N-acetylglucosaminidase 1-like isoform X1 [Punica granatum]
MALPASSTGTEQGAPHSAPDPPFNPLVPAPPVSYPITTLEDLGSRTYFNSYHYPFNVSSVPLSSRRLPDRGRILVCHDMQGGYRDDKWVQGGNNPDAFSIWHWYLIDIFVYFSHNLVTLPPPCWTNTAHRHGVQVLGTFITEGDKGTVICNKLLATKESAQLYAKRLTELAVSLGFDGWLLNMEVQLDKQLIPNLLEFVRHLTEKMHSSVPGSSVIWYDSVTIDGDLIYQNQLNQYNKPFFDICDGIFANYSWEEDYPKLSAAVAGKRNYDVYMGIDVFGRGTYGGGQWKTNVALDVLKKDRVSAAIFAPGWVYETNQPPDFETAQNRWWGLVEDSWGMVQTYPKALPFYSNFDQGRGHHYSINGNQISSDPWNNISRQGFQPFVKFGPSSTIQVLFDFNGESYSGGGNITFKGILSDNSAYFTTRLFRGELPLGSSPIQFTYSVKSGGSSKIGLSLEFSSPENQQNKILLASQDATYESLSQFAGNFTKVLISHEVSNPKSIPELGWVLQENSISMKGSTLTEIHAVCYQEKPDTELPQSPSEFYAVLGHILIKAPGRTPDFPPASSWIVEGQYIKWGQGSQGSSSKSLSIKISWKFKRGNGSPLYNKYNIYLVELARSESNDSMQRLGKAVQFIGTAHVGAFYISKLAVPGGISTIRFIIQVCNDYGACQELDKSPFFQLNVPAKLSAMKVDAFVDVDEEATTIAIVRVVIGKPKKKVLKREDRAKRLEIACFMLVSLLILVLIGQCLECSVAKFIRYLF